MRSATESRHTVSSLLSRLPYQYTTERTAWSILRALLDDDELSHGGADVVSDDSELADETGAGRFSGCSVGAAAISLLDVTAYVTSAPVWNPNMPGIIGIHVLSLISN